VCISSVVHAVECLQSIKHAHVLNTCYKTHKAMQQLIHYSELGYDSDDGLQTALSRPRAAVRHMQSPALGVWQAASLRKITLSVKLATRFYLKTIFRIHGLSFYSAISVPQTEGQIWIYTTQKRVTGVLCGLIPRCWLRVVRHRQCCERVYVRETSSRGTRLVRQDHLYLYHSL